MIGDRFEKEAKALDLVGNAVIGTIIGPPWASIRVPSLCPEEPGKATEPGRFQFGASPSEAFLNALPKLEAPPVSCL